MTVFESIQSRRSIRRFSNKPVEREKLERILEAMRLAPSAVNLQEWRFFIVTNPELLQTIRSNAASAPAMLIAAGNGTGRMTCGHERSTVDLTIAMTLGVLQAQALGLGTCIMASFEEAHMRKALALPPEWRVPLIAPLGYPDEAPEPRPRKAFAEVCCILD